MELGFSLSVPDEPFCGVSPMYMPIAWAVVLIQVGYLGYLISKSRVLVVGSKATFMISLIFIRCLNLQRNMRVGGKYIPTKEYVYAYTIFHHIN